MNKKTEVIHLRIDSETKAEIKKEAQEDHRTFSAQCAMILENRSR
jgi:hypothetical protein